MASAEVKPMSAEMPARMPTAVPTAAPATMPLGGHRRDQQEADDQRAPAFIAHL